MAPLRRTTENPPRPTSRRGQDSWALITPGLDDSTAPTADECQFFPENVAAKFGCRQASRLDRRSCCVSTLTGRGGTMLSNAWLFKADRQVLSAALGSGMEVCSTRGNDKAYLLGGEIGKGRRPAQNRRRVNAMLTIPR